MSMELKSIKGYLIEFILIFLAVTISFFAENVREYRNERDLETEYIKSFSQDLSADTIRINSILIVYNKKIRKLDSLIILLAMPAEIRNRHLATVYENAAFSSAHEPFNSNNLTMQKLKNSGNMQIIQSEKVYDNLAKYELLAKRIEVHETYNLEIMQQKISLEGQVFNAMTFLDMHGYHPANNPRPMIENEMAIRGLSMMYLRLSWSTNGLRAKLSDQKKEAAHLLELIRSEYGIE